MKYVKATILTAVLTIGLSTSASAGNIGMRTTGNIGMRTTGNIGMRTTGNIGMRGAGQATQNGSTAIDLSASRFTLETLSGTFAGLIRMLLESGALL
jgi:hypothetical protein